MAAAWPSGLPQTPLLPVRQRHLPNYVQFEPDNGPPRRRRRSTKRRIIQTVSIELTGAQCALLQTFYETTLADGTLSFDWTDAIQDTAAEFMFVEPPDLAQWTGATDPDDRLYTVTLDLEVV